MSGRQSSQGATLRWTFLARWRISGEPNRRSPPRSNPTSRRGVSGRATVAGSRDRREDVHGPGSVEDSAVKRGQAICHAIALSFAARAGRRISGVVGRDDGPRARISRRCRTTPGAADEQNRRGPILRFTGFFQTPSPSRKTGNGYLASNCGPFSGILKGRRVGIG